MIGLFLLSAVVALGATLSVVLISFIIYEILYCDNK
jgi:hypothetical protein